MANRRINHKTSPVCPKMVQNGTELPNMAPRGPLRLECFHWQRMAQIDLNHSKGTCRHVVKYGPKGSNMVHNIPQVPKLLHKAKKHIRKALKKMSDKKTKMAQYGLENRFGWFWDKTL